MNCSGLDRAGPSWARAELSQAELGRAEPSRTGPSRAEPRPEPGQADPHKQTRRLPYTNRARGTRKTNMKWKPTYISATVPQAHRACLVQCRICKLLKKGIEDSLLLRGNRSQDPFPHFPRAPLFELLFDSFFHINFHTHLPQNTSQIDIRKTSKI